VVVPAITCYPRRSGAVPRKAGDVVRDAGTERGKFSLQGTDLLSLWQVALWHLCIVRKLQSTLSYLPFSQEPIRDCEERWRKSQWLISERLDGVYFLRCFGVGARKNLAALH
jgi:hypothetical protein